MNHATGSGAGRSIDDAGGEARREHGGRRAEDGKVGQGDVRRKRRQRRGGAAEAGTQEGAANAGRLAQSGERQARRLGPARAGSSRTRRDSDCETAGMGRGAGWGRSITPAPAALGRAE